MCFVKMASVLVFGGKKTTGVSASLQIKTSAVKSTTVNMRTMMTLALLISYPECEKKYQES